MTDKERQGPASGAIDSAKRILTLLVGMVETRMRLAIVELEEEKTHLVQLLLMIGLTLIFTTFGLMGLIAFIIWGMEPQYRFLALGWITATLLGLALFIGLWTWIKARRATLLKETRKALKTDRELLEDKEK